MSTPNLPEFDPRFDPAPVAECTSITDDARQARQRRVAVKARAERAKMVATGLHALSALGLDADAVLDRRGIRDFLGIERSTLDKAVARNGDELAEAGWDRGDAFTAPAVATIALILRPQANPRVAQVQRAISPDANPVRITFDGGAAHRARVAAVYRDALTVAEDLRDHDPAEVWVTVREMPDEAKDAMVIALAAIVDVHSTTRAGWLRRQDPDYRVHPFGGSPTSGLATIIPTADTAHGVTVGDLYAIDDEAVGL